MNPEQKAKRKPGKSSPAIFALDLSKASAPPKLHQRNTEGQSQNQEHHLKSKPSDSGLEALKGLVADAFFGASPVVASALDLRVGRDPFADCVQINMHLFSAWLK